MMHHNGHRLQRAWKGKKPPAIDLTNSAVKRKATLAAWKAVTGRAGDLAYHRGRDAELLDPPVYRVQPTRRNSLPTPGTDF